MRFQSRQIIRIILIFISTIASCSVFGQVRYPFITPEIDSICRNTLDYVRIKQSLTSQQYAIGQDAEHLQNTINILNQHLEQTLNEQEIVDSELAAINRYLDSLTPKRPDGPRPKENIIDILYERLSFHGSYGLNLNQLALSNWAATHGRARLSPISRSSTVTRDSSKNSQVLLPLASRALPTNASRSRTTKSTSPMPCR